MEPIIYSTEFYCKLCKLPTKINLHSAESNFPITDKVKEDVLTWGQHYHWVDNHQVCAICGKLVRTGEGTNELDLIQTETMRGDVHPLYIEWDIHPDRGLLTVHKDCAQQMFAEADS